MPLVGLVARRSFLVSKKALSTGSAAGYAGIPMTRRPKPGDEVRRGDHHQHGTVVSVDPDGSRAIVHWPHLKGTDEVFRDELVTNLVVVTPR